MAWAIIMCVIAPDVLAVHAEDSSSEQTVTTLESGAVVQQVKDITAYRTEGSFTAPSAPEGYGAYIFAGWYTDAECTAALEQSVTSENLGTEKAAYAKFVPGGILGVQAQIPSTATYESSPLTVRFVTTVDSLNYQKVGFDFSINGNEKSAESREVYKKLYAVGSTTGVMTYEPTAFHEMSQYFMACNITGVPVKAFGQGITATPYWITLDGTKVSGETADKSANMGLKALQSSSDATKSKDLTTLNKTAATDIYAAATVKVATVTTTVTKDGVESKVWPRVGLRLTNEAGDTVDFVICYNQNGTVQDTIKLAYKYGDEAEVLTSYSIDTSIQNSVEDSGVKLAVVKKEEKLYFLVNDVIQGVETYTGFGAEDTVTASLYSKYTESAFSDYCAKTSRTYPSLSFSDTFDTTVNLDVLNSSATKEKRLVISDANEVSGKVSMTAKNNSTNKALAYFSCETDGEVTRLEDTRIFVATKISMDKITNTSGWNRMGFALTTASGTNVDFTIKSTGGTAAPDGFKVNYSSGALGSQTPKNPYTYHSTNGGIDLSGFNDASNIYLALYVDNSDANTSGVAHILCGSKSTDGTMSYTEIGSFDIKTLDVLSPKSKEFNDNSGIAGGTSLQVALLATQDGTGTFSEYKALTGADAAKAYSAATK